MNRRRSLLSLVSLLMLVSLFAGLIAGCSAAPSNSDMKGSSGATSQGAPAESPKQSSESLSDSASRAAAPAPSANGVAPVAPAAPTTGSSSAPAAASWDRMVIRNANLNIVVKNVEDSVGQIRQITDANQGYTAAAQTAYKGEFMTATVTVQVPAQQFDSVVQQVRKLAVKVQSENTNSQDVTEEFTDLQSQIRNLQATEQSLLKLMDRATSVSDVIALQRELTNVRGQIERLQGRSNYLQRRTDMSTLVVSIIPEALANSQDSGAGWDILRTIRNAWESSLDVVKGLIELVVAIIVFSWWLIPIVALVVWLIRRRRRNRPAPAAPAAPVGPGGQPPTA